MAMQINNKWKRSFFHKGYMGSGRTRIIDAATNAVLVEEMGAINPAVVERIIADHNELITAKELLVRARRLVNDYDEVVRMKLEEEQTDWLDDAGLISKFYRDLEKINLAD